MKALIILLLATAASTPIFGDATADGRTPVPEERKRLAETELDRCDLGQPGRFSEPP